MQLAYALNNGVHVPLHNTMPDDGNMSSDGVETVEREGSTSDGENLDPQTSPAHADGGQKADLPLPGRATSATFFMDLQKDVEAMMQWSARMGICTRDHGPGEALGTRSRIPRRAANGAAG